MTVTITYRTFNARINGEGWQVHQFTRTLRYLPSVIRATVYSGRHAGHHGVYDVGVTA